MREQLTEKVNEKIRATEKTKSAADVLRVNIRRKERIIVELEGKIDTTKEGISEKQDALDLVEDKIAEQEETTALMQAIIDAFDDRAQRLVTIYERMEEIEAPIDRAMEIDPSTAPKKTDNVEWVSLSREAAYIRGENATALADIKRVYYGKAA